MRIKQLLSLASHRKMDTEYKDEFLRFNALLSSDGRDYYGYVTITKNEDGKLSIDTKIGSLPKLCSLPKIEVIKDEAQELISVVNSSHADWLNKGYVCNLINQYIEQIGDKFLIDTDNSETYFFRSLAVSKNYIEVGIACKGYAPFRAELRFTYNGERVTVKNAHQFSGGTNGEGEMVIVYSGKTQDIVRQNN